MVAFIGEIKEAKQMGICEGKEKQDENRDGGKMTQSQETN